MSLRSAISWKTLRAKIENEQIEVQYHRLRQGDLRYRRWRQTGGASSSWSPSLITGLLVYLFTRSHRVTAMALTCSLIAVVWQLGILTYLGFGIDPMGILVPFLIFAIAISHGVQMITANRAAVFDGADSLTAARSSFRSLLVPGGVALISDTIGFITIMLIDIEVIQQMAITASLGVATIIFTNLILLPILLSYIGFPNDYQQRLRDSIERMDRFWMRVSRTAKPWPAAAADPAFLRRC